MPGETRDKSIITHISDYCDEITRTLGEIDGDRTKYDASSVYRNAFALCVLQIGELVGILSDDFKSSNPDVPWRDIRLMRNIIAHKYGTFDFDVLWEVITEDIPELKSFCNKYLSE